MKYWMNVRIGSELEISAREDEDTEYLAENVLEDEIRDLTENCKDKLYETVIKYLEAVIDDCVVQIEDEDGDMAFFSIDNITPEDFKVLKSCIASHVHCSMETSCDYDGDCIGYEHGDAFPSYGGAPYYEECTAHVKVEFWTEEITDFEDWDK